MPSRSKASIADILWMTGCLLIPAMLVLALAGRAVWILLQHPEGAGILARHVGGGAAVGLAVAALNLFWRHEELYERRVDLLTGERTPWRLVRTTVTGPYGQFVGAMLVGALVGLVVAVLTT